MKFRHKVRIILILIFSFALISFVYRYADPDGALTVRYDFCNDETPYFSGLSPAGRVLDINYDKCSQEMTIDPVYFDIRLPQSYRQAVLEIDAQIPDGQDLSVGVGINPEQWLWEFADQASGNTYALDLSQARFENNRYRFIISAPGLDASGRPIIFKSIDIDFNKEPMNSSNIWQRFRNLL